MLNMSKILRSVLGKDLDEMSNSELADKVEGLEASHQPKRALSADELMQIPMGDWGDYDVGAVRLVPAAGVEPCELCARVSNKCLSLSDAKFYLEHVKKNHRSPLCLTAMPAYRTRHGSGCDLPEMPDGESSELPGYQVFHKWADDVFFRDQYQAEEDEEE